MNNSIFGKTMENVRNHGDIKLPSSDKRRKRLVSEPNYHSHKHFSEYLMAIQVKKTREKMAKPLYLGMSILDISKTLMYEFWYDYIKSKHGDRAKYTDTDSFVIYIKTENVFEDISNDVERLLDTSNYDKNDKKPLLISKNKRVPGLFKDELRKKISIEIFGFRTKTYGYLIDNDSNHKKAKGTKKCVIKQKLMFENYKDCLFNNKNIYKSQERFKSYYHNKYTEEVNKIVLRSNDDKKLQTSDRITTYRCGTSETMMIKQS